MLIRRFPSNDLYTSCQTERRDYLAHSGGPAQSISDTSIFRRNLLEAAATATLQGHDLALWRPADNAYSQLRPLCETCGKSVAVSGKPLYGVKVGECPGGDTAAT
jgi:hypothetical protein